MARVIVNSELSAYIADRIAGYPAESPAPLRWLTRYVAEFKALPIYVDFVEATGIRACGEFVCWSTEGEYPGVKPVADRYYWLSALVNGCRNYPELRALLPNRPASAVDCRCVGHPLFADGNIVCGECCGLGWVDASDPDKPTRLTLG